MDGLFLTTNNLIGTIAFFAGVVLLLSELLRKGLSRISFVAYACFVLSSIFLSDNVLFCILTIAGLSALFLILLYFYRREQKQLQKNKKEEDEDQP